MVQYPYLHSIINLAIMLWIIYEHEQKMMMMGFFSVLLFLMNDNDVKDQYINHHQYITEIII